MQYSENFLEFQDRTIQTKKPLQFKTETVILYLQKIFKFYNSIVIAFSNSWAVASFVAIGTLSTSHTTYLCLLQSLAGQRIFKKQNHFCFFLCNFSGNLSITSHSPESIFLTLNPALSALLQVVKVATRFIFQFCKMILFLFKNCTISAFLKSQEIIAIPIDTLLLFICYMICN